jgi:hypothetical protein
VGKGSPLYLFPLSFSIGESSAFVYPSLWYMDENIIRKAIMMFDVFYKHIAYVENRYKQNYKYPTLLEGVDFIDFHFLFQKKTTKH